MKPISRTVTFLFEEVKGNRPLNIMNGTVELIPTNTRTESVPTGLPAPYSTQLVDGVASIPNVEPTPALHEDGTVDWAYLLRVSSGHKNSWEYLVGVPDDTTDISYNLLPRYFVVSPNAIGRVTPGPRGDRGEQGEKGLQGLQGPQGIQGLKGDKGDQGVDGAQGVAGLAGASGETGPAGPTGPQGVAGLQGEKGEQGIRGERGPQGLDGATGAQGATGPRGIQGTQGTQGTRGLQGATGATGARGLQGVAGKDGTLIEPTTTTEYAPGVRIRTAGPLVEVIVAYTGAVPTGDTVLASGTAIPASLRPNTYARRGVAWVGGNNIGGIYITASGSVGVINPGAAGSACHGTIFYPR